MSRYFDLFPRIAYDSAGKQYTNFERATDIMFRFRVIRDALANASAYYEYLIKDTDTPDILAFNVYGDSEAHWIILMANEMVDPQYDWPLNSRQFTKYIIDKYGSLESAKTTIHHWEKVIRRTESFTGTTTETRFIVNKTTLTENSLDVRYDYYDILPEQGFSTYNLGNGRTVTEVISGEETTNYDWEVQQNDNKRAIKIIKPEYYQQVYNEFSNLTRFANAPFLRRFT